MRPLVLLADVRLYREGLASALAAFPTIRVAGTAPVGDAGLALVAREQPDLVLLEARSARVPAIVRAVLAVAPRTRVVAFAVADEENDAIECAEAGVAGYAASEASIEDLVVVLDRVSRGEFPCSPRVAALLAKRVSRLAAAATAPPPTSALTERQREILQLIDDGLSNKEIARRLGIEVSTVKNHVHEILGRTGAARRAQAAARLRAPWPARARDAAHRDMDPMA